MPRYCYFPPPPAEQVASAPFCVACLRQWAKQMNDDFGLWPEGGGPPASVRYGDLMREAHVAGAVKWTPADVLHLGRHRGRVS